MRICFSWLKKSLEDIERLSSWVAFLVCVLVWAGTIGLLAQRNVSPEIREAGETENGVPKRIAVRLENFVPVPAEITSEVENSPEELPSAEEISSCAASEPRPITEEKSPDRIDDDSVRETFAEEPSPEVPEENALPESEAEPEVSEEKPRKAVSLPQTQAPSPPPAPGITVDRNAKISAEQSLYGVLAEAVSKKTFYPRVARRNGHAGTLAVRVSIGTDGKITRYSVEKSAVHKLLISGAEETLRRVAEDFVAPVETHVALPAVFIVPVVYELR